MFVTIVDRGVYVRLSRRNLRQLNAMLDRLDPHSMGLARKDENGVSLVVAAEEDSDHYEVTLSRAAMKPVTVRAHCFASSTIGYGFVRGN